MACNLILWPILAHNLLNLQGSFSENGPLLYHPSGFAYNPQHMYAPYPSGTPSRGDGQSYNASLGNPHTGNIYQQSALSNTSLIPSSAPTNVEALKKSQGESSSKRLNSVVAINNNGHSGARPAHTELISGPYGRGILPVNARTLGSQDARVGYDGNRIGTPWSDLPKVAEGQQRHGSSSFSVSGQYGRPLAPLLVSSLEMRGFLVLSLKCMLVKAPFCLLGDGMGMMYIAIFLKTKHFHKFFRLGTKMMLAA